MNDKQAWNRATRAFFSFLREVDAERHQLRCSFRGAWYRGLRSEKYQLLPRLFRDTASRNSDAWLDRGAKLERDKLSTTIRNLARRSVLSGTAAKSLRKDIAGYPKDGSPIELLRLLSEQSDTKARIHATNHRIMEAKAELAKLDLAYKSERESFDSFAFRTGATHVSSWITLAQMRHTGVPTRLLDWTENLQVAVFFAVEQYVGALPLYWERFRPSKKPAGSKSKRVPQISEYPYISKSALAKFVEESRASGGRVGKIQDPSRAKPCVWVMNVISTSERASSAERVWHVHQDSELDYYKRFLIERDWPFDRPLPIYSPWESARIASQQGMFTVHGRDLRPLEAIFAQGGRDDRRNGEFVRQVTMGADAVMGAAKHMITFCGLDHFGLYRDPDSLAAKIDSEFFGWQRRNTS